MYVYISVCDIPMGLADKHIVKDYQITASTYLDRFHVASRARIYTQKDGSYAGGWMPRLSPFKYFNGQNS